MKKIILIVLALLLVSPVLAKDKESREEKQARLDAICEVEREKILVPMRREYVAECVTNKEKSSKEECETFYADYGARMGGRGPLFYDLPECVTAFEFQQGITR